MTACLIIGCRKLAFYDYKLIFAMTIKKLWQIDTQNMLCGEMITIVLV